MPEGYKYRIMFSTWLHNTNWCWSLLKSFDGTGKSVEGVVYGMLAVKHREPDLLSSSLPESRRPPHGRKKDRRFVETNPPQIFFTCSLWLFQRYFLFFHAPGPKKQSILVPQRKIFLSWCLFLVWLNELLFFLFLPLFAGRMTPPKSHPLCHWRFLTILGTVRERLV